MIQTRRTAYITAVILAVLCNIALFCTRDGLGALFGASADTGAMVAEVLPIFLFGLFFYAFSRITTAGFYATEKNLYSYLCVYAEPVLLFVLLLFLPEIWGQPGIWWSVTVSQILTALLAFVLKEMEAKRRKEYAKSVRNPSVKAQ